VVRFGAVVWILSTASVAVASAVSKPNVTSVAERSLSMVLGTPPIFMPLWNSSRAMVWEPSPPMLMTASIPQLAGVANDFVGNIASDFLAVFDGAVFERITAVGRAQNSSAAWQNPADVLQRELVGFLRPD
jgi:hypothetical protein